MNEFSVLCCLLLFAVSVKAQQFICYSDTSCGSDGGRETGRGLDQVACCRHEQAPFGLSFSIEGMEACNLCPIEFGFVNQTFIEREATDTYRVGLAFFSGASPLGGFFLTLELETITATQDDIGFTFNRVFFPPLSELQDELEIRTAEIQLRLDTIAQESNETFRVTFPPNPDDLPGATLINSLEGVIVDASSVVFELSEEDYREREGETGFMPVVITKDSQVFLANPVTFLVIPWTVTQAEAEGLVPSVIDIPEDNNFSPNEADANDFNISRITTVFPADERSPMTDLGVPIRVFDDLVDEANDQYFVAEFRVVAASTMSLISLQQRACRCRIVDNDPLTIGFQLSQYDYFEPEFGNAVFTNVTLVKENNVASEQTFGLNIAFGDPGGSIGVATLEPVGSQGHFDYVVSSPGDFSLLLFFLPANNEVTFSFTLYEDNLAEGTEGFRATLSPEGTPFPNFALPGPTSALFQETLIRILDTDFAIVGFERPSYTVSENSRTAEVCVILENPPVAFDIILDVVPTEVTANSSDFLNRVGSAFFRRGSTSNRTCTRFIIRQDIIYEDTEFFNVTLRLQMGTTGVVINQPFTQVFILDESLLSIGFINAPYQANETDDSAAVEFGILVGNIAPSISVPVVLSFSDDSAAGGSDYQITNPQVFVFDSDTSTHTSMVPIINDDVFELTEIFQASLTFQGGEAIPRVALDPSIARIIIVDDDNIVFGFDPDTYSDSEDVATQTLTVRQISGDAGAFQFILSAATDDSSAAATAVAGSDYESTSGSLTPITIGQGSADFSVNIFNDDFTERSEIFEAILTGVAVLTDDGTQASLSAQESGRIQFSPDRAQVEIVDADDAIIGFSPDVYSSLESEGPINFNFSVLQGNIAFDLTVLFTASNGSAVSGSDYQATSEEYIITGTGSVIAPVALVDDSIGENTENFFGNLAFGGGETFSNIMFAPNSAEASIIDDDDVAFGFNPAVYSIDESEQRIVFNVTLVSGVLVRNVEIEFFTEDGSAIAGDDYIGTVTTLTFGPDVSFVEVIVDVDDDGLWEIDENFFGNLRLPEGVEDRGNILFQPDRAMATIRDEDTIRIGYVRDYTVTEGVDASVSAEIQVLEGELGRNVVIRAFTMDGTARAGDDEDYIANTEDLTFMPGSSSFALLVGIENDDVVEGEEFFMARAEVLTAGAQRLTIDPEISTITIQDNDNVRIGFNQDSYDIVENERVVSVTIVLTGATDRNITVVLNTNDGTAISSGSERDFVPVMDLAITFPPSAGPTQTRVVQIAVINDMFVERDEMLQSVISLSAGDDQQVDLDPGQASIIIRNDDMVVIGFDQPLYMVDEDSQSGFALVRIRILMGFLRIPVVVSFSTEDGTAMAGSDYQSVAPTQYTFNRAEDSFDIMIPIVNDDIHEVTESFRGRLTTTEDSSIVTLNPASTTIQINDDEMVSFSFRRARHMFIENMGLTTVYIDKIGDTDQTITLMLSGPLQNGGRIDQTITFMPSDTEFAVNFTVIDDLIALEPIESFDWTLALITVVDRTSVQPFNRTTIEIMDNDELELRLSKNGQVNENATNAQACIGFSTDFATDFMINTAAGAPVNVSAIIQGIATSGEDFTPPQSSLTATAGTYNFNNPLCFDIPINDDMFVEVEECFMVSISLPASVADLAVSITDDAESSVCCIVDNDRVRIGFEEILYEVDENDPSGRVTVGIIVFGDNPLRRSVEVMFNTRDGSATSTDPRDYESLMAPAQFDAIQSRVVFSINIDDDDILENTENFFGQLTASVSDDFIDIDPAQTEIRIFDLGDDVTIGFRPDSYSVNETDGSVTLNVEVLDGMLERSVTVLFFTESGTATQEAPADYSSVSEVLTFDPNMLSQGVPVTIINDDRVEGTETFFANLDNQGQPVMTNPRQATVLIFEDPADRVTIGFERTSYPTPEGAIVEACARILDGDIERDVAVRVSSVAGTASAGAGDYESVDVPLLFTSTADRRCFNVTVNDDDILENEERFTLDLDSDDPMVTLNPEEAEVIITDTDDIIVALEQTEFTATEMDGAFIEVCAIITSDSITLDRDAVVTLQSTDGTATSSGEVDFVALNSDLTFSSGVRRICRNISIVNDAFYEDPENFQVSLSTTDPSVSIDPTRQTGEATIEDNDSITIGFVRETDSVAENTPGTIDLCVVVLSGMLERSATVTVATADAGQGLGFATGGGVDYSASPLDYTFTNANRDIPQCLPVTIIDDELVEGSEVFLGMLSNTNSIPRLLLDPQSTTVTIADNEIVSIGFINTPYREREDNGPAVITVEARGDLQKEIDVMVFTEFAGSAITDVDFFNTSTIITFNQTVNVISVDIPLIDDEFVEGDETLNVRIAIITSGNIQLFTPDTELVTIVDDDRVVIGLDETMVSVSEDVGRRELCASIISGIIMRDVLVNVVYEDRNARDVEDYNADPRVLTFSPGVDSVCFNVSIVDDDRYELDEDFFVNITTTDPQAEVNPMTTLVSIMDNEILMIGWEFPEYSVAEADGEVEICAVVSGATQAVTLPRINILPVDGTATTPGDYGDRPDPRFFDFQSNTPTRMCARITIAMDGILEPTESFFADLADLPTQRVVYNPQRTTIVISDSDDATIGFRPETYSVSESDGFVDLVVEVLEGTLATDVVVQFTTSDGSATSVAPVDYSNPGVVLLTFNSSVSSIPIRVTIQDDQIVESAEEFFGNLERVTDNDRVTVAPNAASVTITDNDVPIIGFEMTMYDAAENNSVTTEVCAVVMMPPSLDRIVSVVVTTSDGTAQAPVDYTSLTMTLVFAPGDGRQCVQVDAREDRETEGPETFTVTLTSTENVDLNPDEATITIMDENDVRIRFGRISYTFNESDGTGTIEVVKVGVSSDPIRVRVTGGPSTQTDVVVSADAINSTIEFPAGGSNVASIPITFNINDDEIGLEAVETYVASLEIISSVGNVLPGVPDMTSINILDDDIVNVTFGRPMVIVNEDDGQFMMCVIKDRVTLMDVIVTITSSPVTATPGADYTPENIPSSVTIPAGDLSACFVSPSIVNDDIALEDNETFILEIPSTDPRDPRILIDDPRTTVIIEDNDVVTVRFEQPTYTVREDAGMVEVCLLKEPRTPGTDVIVRFAQTESTGSATPGADYNETQVVVRFPAVPTTFALDMFCFQIPILRDNLNEPTEHFDVSVDDILDQVVTVNPGTARVFIENVGDVIEVNDTVIGDPLFTVPILVPEEQLAALNLTRLTMCYEIHGNSDQWFNLVTDECTSVNARYDDLNEDLNIIDEIGVRTVDSAGRCLNIGVNVEQCAAQINGAATDRYSRDGVSVRRYGNRRVRISVPNCNDYMLVMWVICEQRTLDDPFQPGLSITAEMIKFVVMRGLNTGHRPAHGLLGQFWNVPVGVTPYTGQLRSGEQSQGRLVLNLTTPGSEPRSFTGWLYDLTWEFEEGPCLYVGNRQAGPIYEVRNPNDEVIANLYSAYQVQSAFSEENYDFGMFDESRCVLGSGDGGEMPV